MTEKTWQTLKVQYCHHADEEVGLEAELVYPPEILPDQPPRIFAGRYRVIGRWTGSSKSPC